MGKIKVLLQGREFQGVSKTKTLSHNDCQNYNDMLCE